MTRMRWAFLAPAVLVATAACEEGPIGPESDLRPQFNHGGAFAGPAAPVAELLIVCKEGPAGTYDFSFSITSGNNLVGAGFSLDAGECRHVATSGSPATATISETTQPAGVQFASVSAEYTAGNATPEDISGATIEVTIGEKGGSATRPSGATVTYVNELIPGDEGCTPGYWKNHTDSWAATGYTTGQTLESVFDVPDALGLDNVTLLDALSFGGGPGALGGAKILLRAAVAGLLNASHPGVSYTTDAATLIADVNAALASGNRATMLALADDIDSDNNLGCPLN